MTPPVNTPPTRAAVFFDLDGTLLDTNYIVVHGDDVASAKPAPDIFRQALEEAHGDPARSVAIGDTVWDVKAAGEPNEPA